MPILSVLGRRTTALLIAAVVAIVVSLILVVSGAPAVITFAATAVGLGVLASLVGEGTDQISARMSPAATGILQSGLGNLPELFIAIFSLQAGLVVVVQSALIGSILANSLLVLGIAFVVGGLRHGAQRFEGRNVRAIATLLLLAVAALVIPTLATEPGAPDAGHATDLSVDRVDRPACGLRGLGALRSEPSGRGSDRPRCSGGRGRRAGMASRVGHRDPCALGGGGRVRGRLVRRGATSGDGRNSGCRRRSQDSSS